MIVFMMKLLFVCDGFYHRHHCFHCTDWRPRNFSGDPPLPSVVKARPVLGYGMHGLPMRVCCGCNNFMCASLSGDAVSLHVINISGASTLPGAWSWEGVKRLRWDGMKERLVMWTATGEKWNGSLTTHIPWR